MLKIVLFISIVALVFSSESEKRLDLKETKNHSIRKIKQQKHIFKQHGAAEKQMKENEDKKVNDPTLLLNLKATVENDEDASPCKPKCEWQCEKSECDQVCEPICEPPRCSSRCQDLDCSVCDIKCEEPICEVRCPVKDCQFGSCPPCSTVCNQPVCHTECVNPEPTCQSICEEPLCDWECGDPIDCPQPNCELVCEKIDPDCLDLDLSKVKAPQAPFIGKQNASYDLCVRYCKDSYHNDVDSRNCLENLCNGYLE